MSGSSWAGHHDKDGVICCCSFCPAGRAGGNSYKQRYVALIGASGSGSANSMGGGWKPV